MTVTGKTSLYTHACNDVNCLNDSSFTTMQSSGNNFELWAAIYLEVMHWAVNSDMDWLPNAVHLHTSWDMADIAAERIRHRKDNIDTCILLDSAVQFRSWNNCSFMISEFGC